jgi:two-component system, LytTR family, response regulator
VKIRALIVDDEPLARRGVRARLEGEEDVEIAGECRNGREAVSAIRRLAPDLVFLDLQMPGLDGFGVVRQVGASSMPMVIFVTAHDQHAIRAFEVEAVDYLLKPIDDGRFRAALQRARTRLGERSDGSLGRRLAALLGGPAAQRIAVRDRGRIVLIGPREIDSVQSEGDYASIRVADKTYLVRETMTAMETRLGAGFVRIHRSAIVNVARIRELRPQGGGEFVVVLQSGLELRASRGYADRVRGLIGDPL